MYMYDGKKFYFCGFYRCVTIIQTCFRPKCLFGFVLSDFSYISQLQEEKIILTPITARTGPTKDQRRPESTVNQQLQEKETLTRNKLVIYRAANM